MRLMPPLLLAIFVFASSAAHAEIITVRDTKSARGTTIIRGAPLRCDASQPVVIKVHFALRHAGRPARHCKPAVYTRSNVTSVINIVFIHQRHKPIHIKVN